MYLFEDDYIANATTIRGIRYITVSFYGGGERDIFQKIGDLITGSLSSSNVHGDPTESSLDLDIAIPDA